MIVIFARNNHWISKLVRWRTNSQWSHVGILDDDGKHVIEAMGSVGVVSTRIEYFLKRYPHHDYRFIDGDINKAKSKLGQMFDIWGLWGIFFRRKLEHPDKWFCSELVAYASTAYGDEHAYKVTPENLWWISEELL